jgi:hypothetical protein
MSKSEKKTNQEERKEIMTDEERQVILHKEWEAMQQERQAYELTEAEHTKVMNQLIDRIDQYFFECAVGFRWFRGASITWLDEPWLDDYIEALEPYTKKLKQKIASTLPQCYPGGEPGEPDSELNEVLGLTEKWAYIIGIFFGAKIAGAPKEKLKEMVDSLIC